MANHDIGYETVLFGFFDRMKSILNRGQWGAVAADCSKNELLALFLLYRTESANMSEIASYLDAPLNTATGVVNRLEGKGLIVRERQESDRRIVNIKLTESGSVQISELISRILSYVEAAASELTDDELETVLGIAGKVMTSFSRKQETAPKKHVNRIKIE